jgi:hypothetical protein
MTGNHIRPDWNAPDRDQWVYLFSEVVQEEVGLLPIQDYIKSKNILCGKMHHNITNLPKLLTIKPHRNYFLLPGTANKLEMCNYQ